MRILQTLFLLVSFSFFANAEKKSVVLEDGTKCNYEIHQGVLNGEYRSYYGNGKLKSEGTFLSNDRSGFWVFYNADGKIKAMRDYKDNFSYEEKTADNKSRKVELKQSDIPASELLRTAADENQVIQQVEQQHNQIAGSPANK